MTTTTKQFNIVRYELRGRSIGEESTGYTFSTPAVDNVSVATRGHIQGHEAETPVLLADGWTYLPEDSFSTPWYGPGLQSPDGTIYRDGLDTDCNAALAAGGMSLISQDWWL